MKNRARRMFNLREAVSGPADGSDAPRALGARNAHPVADGPDAPRALNARNARSAPNGSAATGAVAGERKVPGARNLLGAFGWPYALIALGVISMLGACSSSPPMRYYTLSVAAPGASGRAGASTENANLIPIQVGRVTIPGEIDRTQLVSRIDANRLKISDMDRWAAPLDEMIRRTLASDLAARLPPGAVSDLDDSRAGQKRRVLSLDIQEFHGGTDCSVTLRAAWMIAQPDSPGARGTESVQVPSTGICPDALPAGMSQALAELSDRLAAAIGRDAKLGAQ